MTDLATIATGVGIAVGGFGLIKAGLELFDRFSKRRIAIERGLTSAPDIGNSLTIVNLSDKPLMISAWDIVWARRRPWGHSVTRSAFDGDWESHGLTVEPHSRKRFDFCDQDHFSTNAVTQKRYGRLYCRIWVAGSQRAKWLRLL